MVQGGLKVSEMLRIIPAWSLLIPLALVADGVRGANAAYDKVEPILMTLCYDCHGDGMDKGDFAMDDWDSVEEHLKDFDVWYEIWKNVRSNLMPPADKNSSHRKSEEKFSHSSRATFSRLITKTLIRDASRFARLNREEYRNTIKDIFRIDFDVENILPPDDTGYGFDTIGDVLSISPLLMEKYLEAASKVSEEVVPQEGPQILEWWLNLDEFKDERKADWGVDWIPFDHPEKCRRSLRSNMMVNMRCVSSSRSMDLPTRVRTP